MKINWKVRLRNPYFYLTIIPTLITLIYTLLGAFDVVPSISESVVVEWLGAIVTALASIGILNDPTTDGLNDSQRALGYEQPYVSDTETTYEDEDE